MGGGPPRFPPDITCPAVLTQHVHACPDVFAYGTLTRSGGPFQRPSASVRSTREGSATPSDAPVQPPHGSGGTSAAWVWAPPRSLAATRGILSFPRGTEMFQFPRCPRFTGCPAITPGGLPIRTSPDHRLPAPPGAFRRVAASFIGPQRQGIHHAPIFVAIARSPTRRAPPSVAGSRTGARPQGPSPPTRRPSAPSPTGTAPRPRAAVRPASRCRVPTPRRRRCSALRCRGVMENTWMWCARAGKRVRSRVARGRRV